MDLVWHSFLVHCGYLLCYVWLMAIQSSPFHLHWILLLCLPQLALTTFHDIITQPKLIIWSVTPRCHSMYYMIFTACVNSELNYQWSRAASFNAAENICEMQVV